MTDRSTVRIAAIAIALAVVAAYAGSFAGVFVLDDPGTILANPSIRSLASGWRPPATGLPVSGRPLANESFAINYALGGTAVAGYHAVNLLIHLSAALALFGICRRSVSTRFGFAVALLWAVHPVQTAAVTYLSQRAESLMGLWYLLTVYCFLRAAGGPEPAPPRMRTGWAILSVLGCALGMATKEVMVTAPLVVLLYDRTFLVRGAWKALRMRKHYYAALASTWLILVLLVGKSGTRAGTAGFGSGVSWWQYGMAQVGATAHYLRLAVLPFPLIADYGRTFAVAPSLFVWDSALLAVLACGSAVLLWRRSPLGFAGAWWFIVLAPSSSVVPIATEIVAEHRMYLPLAAAVAVGVAAVTAAAARLGPFLRLGPRSRKGALACGLFLTTGVFMGATMARNRVYGSLLTFWQDDARKLPANAGARNNLGNVYAGMGDWAAAAAEYRAALEASPDYADAHANLGGILLRQGEWEACAAHYEAALRYRPEETSWRKALAWASYQLGRRLAAAGRMGEAAERFGRAAELQPDASDVRVDYGNALAQLERPAEAALQYRAALALDPSLADVHNNLGGLLAQSGHFSEAAEQFEAALRLKPEYREARDNLEAVRRIEAGRTDR